MFCLFTSTMSYIRKRNTIKSATRYMAYQRYVGDNMDTSNQAGGPNNKKIHLNTNGTVKIEDSAKFSDGTGDDLQSYHDGTNSTIVNTTGELIIRDDSRIRIRTDSFVVNSGDNTESIIYAVKDGAVELYYDDSKKFETT